MKPTNPATRPVRLGIAALVAMLLLGGLFIHFYLGNERQRDLAEWEIRLGLLADSRTETIERWLGNRHRSLEELANNASLQLYLSQVLMAAGADQESNTASAQLGYLRNLLLATAQREGFLDAGPPVAANLGSRNHHGLALLDAEGRTVAATSSMPPLGEQHREAARRAIVTGERQLVDLYLAPSGTPLLAFVVPVSTIQGAALKKPAGVLIGIEPASQGLYPLLVSSRLLADGDESLLLRTDGPDVVYLSPLRDDSTPVKRRLSGATPELSAWQALERPGQFLQGRDYQGVRVLAISRPIPVTPWILLQKTHYASAMREANDHRRFLLINFSLLLNVTGISLVAAWRHGSSVRAQETADTLRQQAAELDHQRRLLQAITDHVPAFTALLDEQGRLVFANTPFASTTGMAIEDLGGKTLSSLLGGRAAAPLDAGLGKLPEDGGTRFETLDLEIDGRDRTFRCAFVPLPHSETTEARALLVLADITELQEAELRRSRQMRNLIGALMHVVDLHDPHSGYHTERMVEVANAIGETMELGPADATVLELASSLANLGKIFVPREVLTKTGALTEAEQDLVQRHVRYGVDMLSDLEFEGPVLETIEQKQEHLDGSGYPQGLSGEQILLTARILAVANAFVALMSPRAYRGGATVEDALNRLLEKAGSHYDRHVVAALFHAAENRNDWSNWEDGRP